MTCIFFSRKHQLAVQIPLSLVKKLTGKRKIKPESMTPPSTWASPKELKVTGDPAGRQVGALKPLLRDVNADHARPAPSAFNPALSKASGCWFCFSFPAAVVRPNVSRPEVSAFWRPQGKIQQVPHAVKGKKCFDLCHCLCEYSIWIFWQQNLMLLCTTNCS